MSAFNWRQDRDRDRDRDFFELMALSAGLCLILVFPLRVTIQRASYSRNSRLSFCKCGSSVTWSGVQAYS
ncbi:hypothetical protein D3C75_1309490 [compost metagenome]